MNSDMNSDMNNDMSTFISSFAPNKMTLSYYVINDKKYITNDNIGNIYDHIDDMIILINKHLEMLKTVKLAAEEDRDYLTFDVENAKQIIINQKLQIENVYLYEGLEEYMRDYYNIHACKELKNYENNAEEFLKKKSNDVNFKFTTELTTELKQVAKLFRLRYKNNQHNM